MFRLAAQLGYTVGELGQRLTSHELSEWMAYAQIEPFGQGRTDLGAGVVAATVANASGPRKKGQAPFRPEDFMPGLDIPHRDRPRENGKSLSKSLRAAFSQLKKTKP